MEESSQQKLPFLQLIGQQINLTSIPPAAFLLVSALLFFFYWFGIRPFNILKACGLSHRKTIPFLGNIPDFLPIGLCKFHEKCKNDFGYVYGYYVGRRPVVAVWDLEILERVFVKDFQNFHNRPDFLGFGIKPMDKGLLICDYHDWKKIRPALSPSFSSGKIKQMLQFVEKSLDTYVGIIEKTAKKGEAVEIFGSFGHFTMEVIMSIAFALENDFQLKGNKKITEEAYRWFKINPLVFFIDIFPIPMFIRTWMKTKTVADPSFFVNLLKPVVEERRKNPTNRTDFLQLLLSENKSDGKLKLNDDEIFASAITFLLAGYETTSNALSYTLYLLALHQDAQQKLYEEIRDNFDEEAPLYDEIQKLPYLDSVLNESLRMYPPAYITGRISRKDYQIGNYTFPAGCTVQVPIYNIHHNAEFWEEPEKFDPSRFSPDRKSKIRPCSFLPFGYGPRNCIGARLATVESKLAIVKVLKKFHVDTSPETEIPLKLRHGLTMSPENGIKLKIKERL